MKTMQPIIKIENLYAIYNLNNTNSVIAVKNFTYEFLPNKIYCIIGESGSGKSTLIASLNGVYKPSYGDVTIDGVELNSKRYFHNVFLSKFVLKDLKKIKLNKQKFDDKKNYYIIQAPQDVKPFEIALTIQLFNPNSNSSFFKLNKRILTSLGINSKIKNKFYLIESSNPLTEIKEVKQAGDFKQLDIFCKSTKKNTHKKIKNYKEIRKKIGLVFQFPEYQLFKNTVIEDVMFGAYNLGATKQVANAQAIAILNKLGIDERLFQNSPFGLSGGQKRRVAIAGILAIGSKMLVFDEPTAGLDPKGEAEMIKIIFDAKQEGKTVFVVTHSMDQVLQIADEVLVMHNGELIDHGTPYDIFNNPILLKKTNIETPYIIKLINKLIKKDSKFKKLLVERPTNILTLAQALIKIKGKS